MNPLWVFYLQILLHGLFGVISYYYCAQSLSCVQLFCKPKDCSPQGSSVHGISQARILEWLAVPSSRESSRPRNRIQVSHVVGRFFTTVPLEILVHQEALRIIRETKKQ